MKVFQMPRGCGKTTLIIKECHRNGGVILCHHNEERDRIVEIAKSLKCDIEKPLTFDDILNRRYFGKKIDSFYIDNADMLLQQIVGPYTIRTITISQDEV